MKLHDAHDSRLDEAFALRAFELSRLRPLEPDPQRAERVRALCCGTLARRQRRSERVARIGSFAQHVVAPVLTGCVCALYMAALVGNAMRLQIVP